MSQENSPQHWEITAIKTSLDELFRKIDQATFDNQYGYIYLYQLATFFNGTNSSINTQHREAVSVKWFDYMRNALFKVLSMFKANNLDFTNPVFNDGLREIIDLSRIDDASSVSRACICLAKLWATLQSEKRLSNKMPTPPSAV